MKQNSLIEIGSKANIIVRFLTKTTINDKEYQANEPFLFIRDAQLTVQYQKSDPVSKVGTKNIIADSFLNPVSVAIEAPAFTKKIAGLLMNYSEEKNFYPTKMVTLPAEKTEGEQRGYIWLTEEVKSSDSLYVYDKDFNTITFSYDSSTNSISSESFVDSENYLISFSSVEVGTKFILKKPCLPYMSLEIQGIGNIDGLKKKIMLFLSKVSIESIFEINFINSDRIKSPLSFNILDGENYMFLED